MIHQYQLNGYHIVLDVYSGSVHAVDPLAYDAIALYGKMLADSAAAKQPLDNAKKPLSAEQTLSAENRRALAQTLWERWQAQEGVSPAEIEEVICDIEALKAQGRLFSPDIYFGDADRFKRNHSVVKALCLHVAHACNMACDYCFAGKGEYHGSDQGLMSFEVGRQALDFLMEQSGSRVNLEVDFFGGEPLLNWDVVKRLVAYAREQEAKRGKNFRFTLTTNGLLLDDEVIEFANREMYNVVLSLDGRKEVNDRFRIMRDGSGTHDLILPKFKKLADSRGQEGYYMRGTYSHFNTDFTNDIFYMADQGFRQLSMEPVVASPDNPCALTEEDMPVLLQQYELLAEEMLRREKRGEGFTFYHYMIDLSGGPCIYKRVAGCGSGTEYMAVTPSGDLYPCHQFVGEEGYKIGNVFDGVTNPQVQEAFSACNVYSRPECRECWAQLYCSGGCAANAYHATGSINGVYEYGCRLFRKRMECAIMLKVAEAAGAEITSAKATGTTKEESPCT